MPNSITFFSNYYEAAQDMSDDERLAFYEAIFAYAFSDEIPQLEGMPKLAFKLIEPSLEKTVDISCKMQNMRDSKAKKAQFSKDALTRDSYKSDLQETLISEPCKSDLQDALEKEKEKEKENEIEKEREEKEKGKEKENSPKTLLQEKSRMNGQNSQFARLAFCEVMGLSQCKIAPDIVDYLDKLPVYAYDDFVKLVKFKRGEWLDDAKMRKFLTPNTLFSPKHFVDYLESSQHESEFAKYDR